MPRASDGSYSLPVGTLVNTGDTLLTSQHNPAMQDIASAVGASLDRDGLGTMRAPIDMGSNRIVNLSPGLNPGDAATLAQASGGAPVGTVVDFAGTTIPAGWLICGGQSLSRTEYPELFLAIGTAYGSANSSSFTLPDCRGRVSAGRDFDAGGLANRLTTVTPNGTTVGATGGAQNQSLTVDQMPSHSHTGTTNAAGTHTHSIPTGGAPIGDPLARIGGADTPAAPVGTNPSGDHTHTFTTATAGLGQAHPNVQPTILFNKIIRASAA